MASNKLLNSYLPKSQIAVNNTFWIETLATHQMWTDVGRGNTHFWLWLGHLGNFEAQRSWNVKIDSIAFTTTLIRFYPYSIQWHCVQMFLCLKPWKNISPSILIFDFFTKYLSHMVHWVGTLGLVRRNPNRFVWHLFIAQSVLRT